MLSYLNRGILMNIQYFLPLFMISFAYSMEVNVDLIRDEKQETPEDRMENICNSLNKNEMLGAKAYLQCLQNRAMHEASSNFKKQKERSDACDLSRLYHACMLRNFQKYNSKNSNS